MTIEFERGRAYVVERNQGRPRTGSGLLQGMQVIFKHFRDSFTKKLDNPAQTSGLFTIQYPEERPKLPEAFRNFPILLYDDATGHELCTSCFQCQRICPPQVIHMTQAKDPANGKAVPAVAEFLIEYDSCMSCGLCAEVCPFDAIKMDHEFELSSSTRDGMNVLKAGLLRPVSYYEQIAPTFWAEVRDGAMKKLQGNMKRRPASIGIAPQLVAKLKEAAPPPPQAPAAAPEVEGPTAVDARPAPPRPAPAHAPKPPTTAPETEQAAPPAAASGTPEEQRAAKAARLAAIRAANASGAPAPQTAPEAETPADPQAAKAARLAAIRAANEARAADAAPQTAPEAETPADPQAAKAARLAAIRAANEAKAAAEAPPAPEPPAPDAALDPKAAKAARLAAIRAANAAKAADDTPEGAGQ